LCEIIHTGRSRDKVSRVDVYMVFFCNFIEKKGMDISIRLSNGQLLRGIIRSPGENIRAVVIFVHDLCDHVQRYSSWIEKFSGRNFGFVAFDLPGHGRSDGKRGNIKSYSLPREMLDTLIKENKKTFPGVPVFLYGYGMGGVIVLEYILKRNPVVAGAVISSPWLKLSFKPYGKRNLLSRAISGLYPSFTKPAGLDSSHFSHDQGFRDKYLADPLIHGQISVSLYKSALSAADYSLRKAPDLKVPVLMMHGSGDLIASPDGTREFASRTNMAQIKIWEDGYHELHGELFKEELFEYISDWIEKHIPDPEKS
jgi:alpha-beta hydrolase superfamily lysophospholipase